MLNDVKTVVILQRVLPHYRVAFFTRLFRKLGDRGIRLRVLYGQELPGTVPRSVHPDAEWAEYIDNRYWTIGENELVWQSCLDRLDSPALVIIEQANRLLVNYYLLIRRATKGLRLAYWGHGRNLQSRNSNAFRERLKRRLINAVDWWFGYTQQTADMVAAAGFPRSHITIVENSIDTDELHQAMAALDRRGIDALRAKHGLGHGRVALYCGGMYPDKRLGFLLEAVILVRQRIPDLNVIIIGSGPDARLVEQAETQYPWIHYVGAVYGKERAAYFALSDVMLMPGLVGLAVIDSFVTELPMITTDIPVHSPEITYLKHGENGLIAPPTVNEYVAAVTAYLSDEGLSSTLKDGCRESARHYTLDNMVDNFVAGILASLR
jgi:glycosyltransferase involved in cell wall biosynthesis